METDRRDGAHAYRSDTLKSDSRYSARDLAEHGKRTMEIVMAAGMEYVPRPGR